MTATRKERRVAVTTKQSEAFLDAVSTLLGDDKQPKEELKRLQLRDKPLDPDTMFITDSDYLPTFKGQDKDGEDLHKARIRIRKYLVVPIGTPVAEAKKKIDELPRSKIADGDGAYVKLEFKVGKPVLETEIEDLRDMEGVVDKPSITLLEGDVDLLLKDVASFKANHAAVAKRAKAVKLTREGKASPVNDPKEVEAMIARIGMLHEQGWEATKLHPQTNMTYVREAHRIYFPNPAGGAPLEVQITVDKDIHQTYIRSGVEEKFDPDDRIIELKIPEEYADLSDDKLTDVGLGELARLRATYLALDPIEGTKRDGGKPRNLIRRRGGKSPSASPPPPPAKK